MAVTINELIRKLQEQQDKGREVEYLICDTKGELVAVSVDEQAKAMKKIMSMFAD